MCAHSGIGSCIPYSDESNFCDTYINSSSSYVFRATAPNTDLTALQNVVDLEQDLNCQDMVSEMVCNYVFPPCGSTDGVHLPLSICEDACNFVAQTCPKLWQAVLRTVPIACNNTATRLMGLSPCCSDLSIALPSMFVALVIAVWLCAGFIIHVHGF